MCCKPKGRCAWCGQSTTKNIFFFTKVSSRYEEGGQESGRGVGGTDLCAQVWRGTCGFDSNYGKGSGPSRRFYTAIS